MSADYSRIWPYLIAMAAVLLIYRRFRRNFGPQPMKPMRMRVRMGILLLLGLSFAPAALRSVQFLEVELAGLAAGIALGWWGASRTGYRSQGGRLYYIPHTYTGIAVSLLFLGRLVYRLSQVYFGNDPAMMPQDDTAVAQSMAMRTPLTAGIVFVILGYYVTYYGRVLREAGRIIPEELEVVATPIGISPTGADELPGDPNIKTIIERR